MYSKVFNICSIYIYIYMCVCMQFTYCTSNWPCHMFPVTSQGHCSQHMPPHPPVRSRDTSSPPRACCYADPSWKSGLGATVPPPVRCKSKELFFFGEGPSCQNIRSACMRRCCLRMLWLSNQWKITSWLHKESVLPYWIGDAQRCLVHCQIFDSLKYLTNCWKWDTPTLFVSQMYSY